MLTLEASAIANEAQERGLHILEKEMNAVLIYLSNVGTQAALIAGFVFICFTEEVIISAAQALSLPAHLITLPRARPQLCSPRSLPSNATAPLCAAGPDRGR